MPQFRLRRVEAVQYLAYSIPAILDPHIHELIDGSKYVIDRFKKKHFLINGSSTVLFKNNEIFDVMDTDEFRFLYEKIPYSEQDHES